MKQILIEAGTLILRADHAPVTDGAVLIESGKILAAGPVAEVRAKSSPEAVIESFPDGTILPGLIDAHVHLSFDGSPTTVATMTAEDDPTQILAMTGRAQEMLRSGVTTVRDLGDRNGLAVRLRNAINSGLVEGPRILSALAPITVTGGHCWFLGGEADGIDAIQRAVRRNLRDGADVIKVMAGGGNMTVGSVPPDRSQFTVEELRVVADEARRYGKHSAAHSHNAESTARAVAAGIDTIEHCGWGDSKGEIVRLPEVVETMLRNGTFVSPTVGSVMTRPPYDSHAPRVVEGLRWYRESGIKLIGSTDAGAIGTGFGEYADTFPLWIEAGFTPAELLTILTLNTAEALQLEGRVGKLAEGYDADLIVVEGNPLEGVEALKNVSYVMAQGRPYPSRPSEWRDMRTPGRSVL